MLQADAWMRLPLVIAAASLGTHTGSNGWSLSNLQFGNFADELQAACALDAATTAVGQAATSLSPNRSVHTYVCVQLLMDCASMHLPDKPDQVRIVAMGTCTHLHTSG